MADIFLGVKQDEIEKNKKFNLIKEVYSKDYGFLTSLMNDMTRYLCLVDSYKDKIILNNNKNEISEEKKYI